MGERGGGVSQGGVNQTYRVGRTRDKVVAAAIQRYIPSWQTAILGQKYKYPTLLDCKNKAKSNFFHPQAEFVRFTNLTNPFESHRASLLF